MCTTTALATAPSRVTLTAHEFVVPRVPGSGLGGTSSFQSNIDRIVAFNLQPTRASRVAVVTLTP